MLCLSILLFPSAGKAVAELKMQQLVWVIFDGGWVALLIPNMITANMLSEENSLGYTVLNGASYQSWSPSTATSRLLRTRQKATEPLLSISLSVAHSSNSSLMVSPAMDGGPI
jgi:hypothetical protein